MEKEYAYQTCCIDSTGEKINAMIDVAIDITYETMLRNCAGLIEWAIDTGYDCRSDQGLTLKKDWNVSYHKSVYDGRLCYYLVWSAIEFIWTK